MHRRCKGKEGKEEFAAVPELAAYSCKVYKSKTTREKLGACQFTAFVFSFYLWWKMNAVDRFDRQVTAFDLACKTSRWYSKVVVFSFFSFFFYLAKGM